MKRYKTLLGCLGLSLMLSATTAGVRNDKATLLRQLYSSSTPADSLNNPRSLFEDAVAATMQAQAEMPWASQVPDREFRYFVLPLRVNNEALDNSRPVIYNELKERVKGLPMKDAVLEVNHWCHEYVTYEPSDPRTHSPLQSMSSCIGRCGEESTFTVSALRSVGIPARQVYTPRWAHTDDNHAWVEAWADGQWHFLGACEPEPVLDLAWFNDPVTRAMMMHTFVRGEYDGPEEVVAVTPDGVNINVTSTYAPTVTTQVTVKDAQGNPVNGAQVTFRIYNYAEFYPIATRSSDSGGQATLTTGIGDMLVWATDGQSYGFSKVHAGDRDATVALNWRNGDFPKETIEWDFIPPKPGNSHVQVIEAQRLANQARLAHEDSIRADRRSRFLTKEDAEALSAKLGLDSDRLKEVLKDARGNSQAISDFLCSLPEGDRGKGLHLLESVNKKDRSDVTRAVLHDHMQARDSGTPLFKEYVLSPRIEWEALSPWRGYLAERVKFPSATEWGDWIRDNIAVLPDWVPPAVTISPEKVYEHRGGNERSIGMLFVAGCRAMGIPARVNPVDGDVQWADNEGNWDSWKLRESQERSVPGNGTVKVGVARGNRIEDPAYYRHFTLSRITDGVPQLMELDEDATVLGSLSNGISLQPGDYMLVTGQRLANGGVLAQTDFFEVRPGETSSLDIAVRHDDKAIEVIGNFNSEDRFLNQATSAEQSLLSATGRGYYVIVVVAPGEEPSNHVLRDLHAVANDLEATGIPMVVLFSQQSDTLWPEGISGITPKATVGFDQANVIANELADNLKLKRGQYPIVAVADTFNRVVYVSQGYTIGMGQTLLDIIKAL